ncbi:MAG: COX15/CtaA family protein, partial [Chloroflexota bacterium]
MSRFAKYAWFVTGYTILVILWGAVVRITGSGAGCGNHWPACNGEILHRPEYIETMIELSHRLTSALAGFFVLIMLVWAFRKVFEHNQKLIRRMTVMTFIFILIEGALGAALVRFELVADNASTARAVMIALHLVNTLILLGFSTAAAWAASQPNEVRFRGFSTDSTAILTGMLGILLVSAIGAITALGNTLFPSETLIEGIQADFDPNAHFLIQLRIWHPAIALATSGFLFWYGYRVVNRDDVTPQQTN